MEDAEGVEGIDTASTIGQPISFRSGPLAGRLIRCAHITRPRSSAHPCLAAWSGSPSSTTSHTPLLTTLPPLSSLRSTVHGEQDALLGRKYAPPSSLLCPSNRNTDAILLPHRYAVRDRRPLEPPPVLRLRLYEVFNAGTSAQSEVEIPAEYVPQVFRSYSTTSPCPQARRCRSIRPDSNTLLRPPSDP